jgi:hypothetical protein
MKPLHIVEEKVFVEAIVGVRDRMILIMIDLLVFD